MRKGLLFTTIFFIGGIFFSSKVNAQIVVVRPAPSTTVVVKPVPPFPHAVWVEPEWRWDGPTRAYIYVKGYWVKPRGGYVWVPGHWMSLPAGYQWVGGHWRRIK